MENEYQKLVSKLGLRDKEVFIEAIIEEIYNSYGFEKKLCPICENSFNMFLPINGRKNALCPECSSVERHRIVYYYLKNNTNLLGRKISFLDLSPHVSFFNKFNNLKNVDYIPINNNFNSYNSNDNFSMNNLPFEDNSFEVIFNYFNLPKINQTKILKEFHRVLNTTSDSCLILFDFFDFESDKTITTSKKQVYGTDFLDKLKDVGFNVNVYTPKDIFSNEKNVKKYGIFEKEVFIVCTKTKIVNTKKRPSKLKSPRHAF